MLFICSYKTVAFSFVITKEGIKQIFILLSLCIEYCDFPILSCNGYRCLFSHGGYHRFQSRLFVFSKVKISFISTDKSSALGSIGNSKIHWKYYCQAHNEFFKL